MSSSPADLELWVFHDNGSRQAVLEAGMEVLLETELPRESGAAPKTTFILRAGVRGAVSTSAAHEQKGRFTMVLGDLRGYLLPSETVRMRTNGDLQEYCYPDDASIPADEIVAWLCSSQESIAIIFSPVRSDTGRWYPRKKNEGAGFRSLPAMFRSSGVGYMKLGDINTSRFGNQFLSFDKCRTFCNEGGDLVLRRLGLPVGAVARCRVVAAPSIRDAGDDERPVGGSTAAARAERPVPHSGNGGRNGAVSSFGGRDRSRSSKTMAGARGGSGRAIVQPLDAIGQERSGGADIPEGKYSPRSYEGKYSPRGEQESGFVASQQASGAPVASSAKSTLSRVGGEGVRASLDREAELRAVHGPPPKMSGTVAADNDGIAVVPRSMINNIVSLKPTLDTGEAARSQATVGGSSGGAAGAEVGARGAAGREGGTHKHVQVQQYKPPTGRAHRNGRSQRRSSSRTRSDKEGGKVPEAVLHRAGRHKRASTPAEQKRADAHEFQSLMDYMKGDEAKYFEGCERGTTEYNMKIQRLVRMFEEWKVDGRKRPLLDMVQPILTEHRRSSSGKAHGGSAPDEASGDVRVRRSGRGGVVVQIDEGGRGASSPKSPEDRAKERKDYNNMFQAFLTHARSRGFFDGCEKGTPEYNLKIQQCIAKFEELKAKNL